MDFTAIDFETATAKRESACSIGLVHVKDSQVVDQYSFLIQPPENKYNPFNIHIHGIRPKDTADKPTFAELMPTLAPMLEGGFIAAHNAGFDMSVLRYACGFYDLPGPQFEYSCSRIISKQCFPGLVNYKLKTVAKHLGIEFKHHDAMQDAAACAEIILRAAKVQDVSTFAELAGKLRFKIGGMKTDSYAACRAKQVKPKPGEMEPLVDDPASHHPLYRRTVVFTGMLQTMPRKEAMQKVIDVGGKSATTTTLNTNFLVMGEQAYAKFVDGEKSSKTRKAEQFLSEGQDIEIINEVEFLQLLHY